ncbi:ParB/RepB/Spo0J family partition protein [Nitrospira lenta]|uniref:Putative ParB domain protein nuclease n=1 Tax=Nitrospira lenta TaxID=1436998 RepID=A0A330L7B6_9BACT|nr:ParB/RepB/Spo0J family partition protein [Nitrospira lenta]SPP65227.1 putative ParB domain protein nuclease [Nitrospira lenta]
MKPNTWLAQFNALKGRGVDTLTVSERGLRRLPIEEVRTLEAVFQPRQLEDAAASGRHLGELLRVLRDHAALDPIAVMKIGGDWYCIDGHYRLEAYRQEREAGSRRSHLPVKVFSGTLEEALRASIEVNAPDKLNLTKEDKLEAAWRLVVLGQDSVAQISHTSTIAERTVQRMRRGLEQARTLHPSQPFETWTWAKVKDLLRGELKEVQTAWQDAKAGEWAKQLARTFKGLPSEHPRVFAKALLRYNAETAKAIAEEIHQATQQGKLRAVVFEEAPDF